MRAFPHFRVFIQRLDGEIEPFQIPLLCVADPPTLEDLRTSLEQSALGDVEKDIFFPNWTKSLHVVQSQLISKQKVPSWHSIEQHKQTIDTPEKLRSILDNEESSPGTTAIVVQQCRSKRYSRKKDEAATSLGINSNCNLNASTNANANANVCVSSSQQQKHQKALAMSNNNKSDSNNNNDVGFGVALNCVSEPYDRRTMLYVEQPQAYFAPMGMMAPPAASAVYQPCYPYAPLNLAAYNYMGAPSFITAYQPFYTY